MHITEMCNTLLYKTLSTIIMCYVIHNLLASALGLRPSRSRNVWPRWHPCLLCEWENLQGRTASEAHAIVIKLTTWADRTNLREKQTNLSPVAICREHISEGPVIIKIWWLTSFHIYTVHVNCTAQNRLFSKI